MGCGASIKQTRNVVDDTNEKFDKKIENLEDEMREIQMKIKTEEKAVKRFQIQGRTQEAASHLQRIKTLQGKLARTRNRVNKTDRNKEFLDKRQDQAEDIEDLKMTEDTASKIKIDYAGALKTEDKIRSMNDKMDVFDDMIHDTTEEAEVLKAVQKEAKVIQKDKKEVVKEQKEALPPASTERSEEKKEEEVVVPVKEKEAPKNTVQQEEEVPNDKPLVHEPEPPIPQEQQQEEIEEEKPQEAVVQQIQQEGMIPEASAPEAAIPMEAIPSAQPAQIAQPDMSTLQSRIDKSSNGYHTMQLVAENARAKNWGLVKQLCDQLLASSFDLLQSYTYKGKALFHLAEYESAVVCFSKALENTNERNFVKKAKLLYLRAMAYLKDGKGDNAMEDFLACEKENPRNWQALLELGKIFQESGKNDQSVEYLKRSYTFSNYECVEANEIVKKIKKEEAMMEIVRAKKAQLKPENCFAVPLIKKEVVERYRHVAKQRELKYYIQSFEYPQRVITVNAFKRSKADEIVLCNRDGSSVNQQWIYTDEGLIVSAMNNKFLAFDDEDFMLYLSDDSSKKRRFFFQDKFIVCQAGSRTLVIDIKEQDNPGDYLMEMDVIGKGQRNSQAYRFIPFGEIARQKRKLEKQKMRQDERLRKKMVRKNFHQQQNFQQQQQMYVMRSLSKPLKWSIKNKFKKLEKYLRAALQDPNSLHMGVEGINDINPGDGNSVLINAIAYNAQNAVQLLLECGANPNQANTVSGATPLHLCVCWDRPHFILMLRSAGGNPNLFDRSGMNCYRYVKRFGKPHFYLNLLRKPLYANSVNLPNTIDKVDDGDEESSDEEIC